MKKQLVWCALASCTLGAQAADVSLYGIIDTAVNYTHISNKLAGKKTHLNTTSLVSGQVYGSRWGLRGTERLNDEISVGFVLEAGFDSTTGQEAMNRQFGRESILRLNSATLGSLSFGRVGELMSAVGSYAIWGKYSNPMGGSWSNTAGAVRFALPHGLGRYDNTITYESMNLAGAKLYGQYSMNRKQNAEDNGDRYGAVAATVDRGNLGGIVIAKFNHPAKQQAVRRNGTVVAAAGNYTLPNKLKLWLAGQYLENQTKVWDWSLINSDSGKGFKGYGLSLSASYPISSGTLALTTGYFDGKQAHLTGGLKNELSSWGASVGYIYDCSKRLKVYFASGLVEQKQELQQNTNKKTAFSVTSGLVHFF